MKFELFVDYMTDKKYKTIAFTAINEFEAIKLAYEMLTNSDASYWEERKYIYCVNVYRIIRNNQQFLIRYRYYFDKEKLIISPDWRE